jgi:hypothetical protein
MNAEVLVPEAGDFVELILLYQCADTRKNIYLVFRKHRVELNCLSCLSQALVTGWLYIKEGFFTSWLVFARLCKSTYWLLCWKENIGNTSA